VGLKQELSQIPEDVNCWEVDILKVRYFFSYGIAQEVNHTKGLSISMSLDLN